MTSEEIKALGLRVGDVVRVTLEDSIHNVGAVGIYLKRNGYVNEPDIVAIDRVMPGPPDGWTWISAPATVYMMWNKEMDLRASISADGLIDCWSMEPGNNAHYKTPALVAKALLEAWERTQ